MNGNVDLFDQLQIQDCLQSMRMEELWIWIAFFLSTPFKIILFLFFSEWDCLIRSCWYLNIWKSFNTHFQQY